MNAQGRLNAYLSTDMMRETLHWQMNMTMQEITIRVTPAAASFYAAASEEQRRKLDALLSLRLSESAGTCRSLQEIIADASDEAQANGLTPEILEELLDGE